MGGSIRSGLYSKVTHLICNASGGPKYQYAMTFRLDVVRPTWVQSAWERRNDAAPAFDATTAAATAPHRLKPFEGQKICFLGFAVDEHQHMIEVLVANGGVSVEIDDPGCTHVVSFFVFFVVFFCRLLFGAFLGALLLLRFFSFSLAVYKFCCHMSHVPHCWCFHIHVSFTFCPTPSTPPPLRFGVIQIISNTATHFPDNLSNSHSENIQPPTSQSSPMSAQNTNTDMHTDNNGADRADVEAAALSGVSPTTPRSSKAAVAVSDGAVLTEGCDGAEFIAHTTANLSPILKLEQTGGSGGGGGHLQNIDEASEEGSSLGSVAGGAKRKRDSIDNVSLVSTDSMMLAPSGPFSSAKKPKLIRTGSITRGLRRSMSFVALKNPIATVLRSRRNSTVDPNASLTSVGSVDSHTFNESLRKPVADKMRSLRNRIMKSNKRDITPKVSKAMVSRFRQLDDGGDTPADGVNAKNNGRPVDGAAEAGIDDVVDDDDVGGASTVTADVPDFKTPIAPRSLSRFSQLVSTSSTRALFQRADRSAVAPAAATAAPPVVVGCREHACEDAAVAVEANVEQQMDSDMTNAEEAAAAATAEAAVECVALMEQHQAVQEFLFGFLFCLSRETEQSKR